MVDTWVPRIRYTALSSRVIAVATTRIERAWAAYIDAVPGVNHAHEWKAVLKNGDKLPEKVAAVLFPDFVDSGYYAS